ncbi:hypothetical protein KCA24_33740 [Escherichia coli]|nr:hypothetical protein [Escherichia coli]
MAESGYGLAGLGMGKVTSINQNRLMPGFGGFTPGYMVKQRVRCPGRSGGKTGKQYLIFNIFFFRGFSQKK